MTGGKFAEQGLKGFPYLMPAVTEVTVPSPFAKGSGAAPARAPQAAVSKTIRSCHV
jgi:hypothetical protein